MAPAAPQLHLVLGFVVVWEEQFQGSSENPLQQRDPLQSYALMFLVEQRGPTLLEDMP